MAPARVSARRVADKKPLLQPFFADAEGQSNTSANNPKSASTASN